jgi:MFS family permease
VVNALSCVVHKSTGGFLPCFLNTIRNVQKRKLPSLNFNPGCIKVVDTFRLSASFTDIQWVISAYILTYAALLLAAGNYADLHGRKKAMLIGLSIFALASAICGLAKSVLMLSLARATQGSGDHVGQMIL